MKIIIYFIVVILFSKFYLYCGFEIKVYKYQNLLCDGDSDEIYTLSQCSVQGYFQLAGNKNILARIAVSNYTECNPNRRIDNFIKIDECIPNENGFSQVYSFSQSNDPTSIDEYCNEYLYFGDLNNNNNNNDNSNSINNNNLNIRNLNSGDCDKVKIHSFKNGTCKYVANNNEYIKRFCYNDKTIHEYACDTCLGINCTFLRVIYSSNNCSSKYESKKLSSPVGITNNTYSNKQMYSNILLILILSAIINIIL